MGSGVLVQRLPATVRVVILLGCVLIAPLLGGQSTMQNSTTNPLPVNPLANRYTNGVPLFGGPDRPKLDEGRMEAINRLRLKAMMSDTEKLLQLATELKAQVGEGRTTAPTNVDLAKTEQIEKLAQSVQELMKASVGN
jgi:hypothetical protein